MGGWRTDSLLHPSSIITGVVLGWVNPRLLASGSSSAKEWVAAPHRHTEHQKHLMLQTSWAGKKWNCLRSFLFTLVFCSPVNNAPVKMLSSTWRNYLYFLFFCWVEKVHAGSCFGWIRGKAVRLYISAAPLYIDIIHQISSQGYFDLLVTAGCRGGGGQKVYIVAL